MRQIITIKGQTLLDLSVQEYGSADTLFQLVEDNPHLAGLNDFPQGHVSPAEADFDISYPVREGVVINIQDFIEKENSQVAAQLTDIKS